MPEEIFAPHDERNEKLEQLEKQLKGLRILVALFALLNVSGFARYLFYDGYMEVIGYANAAWLSITPLSRLFMIWWSFKHPTRAFIGLFLSWCYYIVKSIVGVITDYYDQLEPMTSKNELMIAGDILFLLFIAFVCYKAWQYEQLKKELQHVGDI